MGQLPKNQQKNRGPKAAKIDAKSHALSTIHICLYVHKDKILWGLIWYIPIFEDVSQNKKKLSEIKPPLQRTGIQIWPCRNTFSLIMK